MLSVLSLSLFFKFLYQFLIIWIRSRKLKPCGVRYPESIQKDGSFIVLLTSAANSTPCSFVPFLHFHSLVRTTHVARCIARQHSSRSLARSLALPHDAPAPLLEAGSSFRSLADEGNSSTARAADRDAGEADTQLGASSPSSLFILLGLHLAACTALDSSDSRPCCLKKISIVFQIHFFGRFSASLFSNRQIALKKALSFSISSYSRQVFASFTRLPFAPNCNSYLFLKLSLVNPSELETDNSLLYINKFVKFAF